MSSRHWSMTVTNDYLGVSKTVRGNTKQDVEAKAAEQVRKWSDQEQRRRKREKAEYDTERACQLIKEFKSLLTASLATNHDLDWSTLRRNEQFGAPPPTLEAICREIGVPAESKMNEFLFPANKLKRLEMEAQARELCQVRLKQYDLNKRAFEQKQREYNESIQQFKADFNAGHTAAIERYVALVLERSRYPEGFEKKYQVQFDPRGGTLVVTYELPAKNALPRITEYKYVASRNELIPVEMKAKDYEAYYEDCLYQICIRTIYEVFQSVGIEALSSCVFNGWVSATDPKTGRSLHTCILSCQAPRTQFQTYNLENVIPRECFRGLKGISAGPLANLAPVRPLLELDKDDPRFVQSREVLAHLDSATNLATIDWEDFEHLVS